MFFGKKKRRKIAMVAAPAEAIFLRPVAWVDGQQKAAWGSAGEIVGAIDGQVFVRRGDHQFLMDPAEVGVVLRA